ncbi:acyltransferase family protein [Undibacterium sp. SXout7W]|uniref:acyltransferase family protein n=1 Tax=Undibacterium sp. SXout7W TaxID=3413049 RepID=UPI003BF403FE
MQNRDIWVDYARGIGIILVVYGHVSRGIFNAGMPMDATLFSLIDSIIYSFHMPLFFFLSGLFFVPSLQKYGQSGLIAEKTDSVMYPYVLWSLLQGFTEVALSHYTTAKTSIPEVLSLLWQPRAQFWFLYALFVVMLFVVMLFGSVMFRVQRQLSAWKILLPAMVLWASQFWLDWPFPFNFLANYLIFFLLGTQFHLLRSIIEKRALLASLISLLAFIAVEYLFHGTLGLRYSDKSFWQALPAIFGILMVCSVSCLLAQKRLLLIPSQVYWLALLGSCSMPIFLIHILTGSGSRIVLSKLLHVHNASLHIIAGMLAGLLLPVLIQKLSEQSGWRRLRYLFTPPPFLSMKKRWLASSAK